MAKIDSPSMKTIAAKAGVSVMTVSRALRNDSEVNKATRNRILKLAEEMGYKKHPYISALMTQRGSRNKIKASPVIALVHCLPFKRALTHNMKVFQSSVHQTALNQGFEVEEFYLNEPGMTARRLVEILETRNIRGVIFEHFFSWGNRLEADFSELACVAIGSTLSEPNFHRVDNDYSKEMQIAISKLFEYGYSRPCLLNIEDAEQHNLYRRRSAFLYGQQMFSEKNRIPIPMGVYHRDDLKSVIDKWMRRFRPDVFLSMQPETPDAIRELGYRIPEDVGFIHFGLTPQMKDYAGVNPNWRQKAVTAVNQVVDLINRNEFGVPENPVSIFVRNFWVDGPSVLKKQSAARIENPGTIDSDFHSPHHAWRNV